MRFGAGTCVLLVVREAVDRVAGLLTELGDPGGVLAAGLAVGRDAGRVNGFVDLLAALRDCLLRLCRI